MPNIDKENLNTEERKRVEEIEDEIKHMQKMIDEQMKINQNMR